VSKFHRRSQTTHTENILAFYCQAAKKSIDIIDADEFWLIKHSDTLYSVDMCLADRLKKEKAGMRFDSIEVDIAGWWALAYPIIEQIATATTEHTKKLRELKGVRYQPLNKFDT